MGIIPPAKGSTASIAVCVCTYQRHEGLIRLLSGLDEQSFTLCPSTALHIIVADNSPASDARGVVESRESRWPCLYLHEPRGGISHARNACLAAVADDMDYIAMTDDDVVPAKDWLDQLLDAQRRSGADVVVGPTAPEFPAGTPAWIEASGFFLKPQNQSSLRDLQTNPPAATCNVLFTASLLREGKLGFDPALNLSGGEDKLLFQQLKRQGVKFAWSPGARAREYFPADRATPGYMLREAYRRGSVKCFIKQRLKSRSPWKSVRIALRLLVRSIFYLIRDLTLLLLNFTRGPIHRIKYGLRIANSIGAIAGVLRIPNHHYRNEGL